MTSRIAVVIAAVLAVTAIVATATSVALWPQAAPSQGSVGGPSAATTADAVPPIVARTVAGPITIQSTDPRAAAARVEVAPLRIAIPAVDVDMAIVATGLAPDGSMALPESSAIAAWYRHGGAPGDPRRAALIAAHVSSPVEGEGPFARLGQLASGAQVAIEMSDGAQELYTVVRTEQVSKQTVNFDAISADSPGMVVLVTCGGDWDAQAQSYDDNVIVWAVSTQVR